MSTLLTAQGVRHYAVIFLVFGVTGGMTVFLSRLVLNGLLGLDGSLVGGPWSYRLVYLALIPPVYSRWARSWGSAPSSSAASCGYGDGRCRPASNGERHRGSERDVPRV